VVLKTTEEEFEWASHDLANFRTMPDRWDDVQFIHRPIIILLLIYDRRISFLSQIIPVNYSYRKSGMPDLLPMKALKLLSWMLDLFIRNVNALPWKSAWCINKMFETREWNVFQIECSVSVCVFILRNSDWYCYPSNSFIYTCPL
jgi:hypothetical protein